MSPSRPRYVGFDVQKASIAVASIARELRAFLWAMAQAVSLAPSPKPLARPDAVRPRVHPSNGRDAAPVWGRPRWRSEAGRDPRAAREAGPRRRQGRWEPTHGEPRAHPSCLTGSGSADGHRSRGQRPCKKNP